MAFCANCGKDMKEAKFCPNCGAPAAQAPGPQAPQPTQAAPPVPPPPAAYQQAAPPPPPGAPIQPGPGMPPPAAPARAVKAKVQSTGAMVFGAVGALAMIVVAIGSALPWVTADFEIVSVSKNGLSGDGVITIVLGFLGLAFFAVGIAGKARWPFAVALAMSLLATAIAAWDTIDVSGGVGVSVGIGLILCLVAGIIGVVAAIGGVASPRTPA